MKEEMKELNLNKDVEKLALNMIDAMQKCWEDYCDNALINKSTEYAYLLSREANILVGEAIDKIYVKNIKSAWDLMKKDEKGII